MKTSCRASNLRPLLQDSQLRPFLQEFLQALDRKSGEDKRGLRLDAILRGGVQSSAAVLPPPDPTLRLSRLDDATYIALLMKLNAESVSTPYVNSAHNPPPSGSLRLPHSAQLYLKTFIRGIFYHVAHSSSRDSNILFTLPTFASPCVGCIVNIFSHSRPTSDGTRTELFLLVRRYRELTPEDAVHDLFRQFPVAGGRLVYDAEEDRCLIRPCDVVCHVAHTKVEVADIASACRHILPLDRVSLIRRPYIPR